MIRNPWIPVERVQELVQIEPALLAAGLTVGAGLFYGLFLRKLFAERHRSLRSGFKNLAFHLIGAETAFACYQAAQRLYLLGTHPDFLIPVSYLGLLTLIWGAIVFVKIARIFALEYLYVMHMNEQFPLLIVNLFTFILSISLACWLAADVFGIKLTPLIATSAVLSLVLGLALQDTLGNLFAGVALQFDQPYAIGDWIEIQNGMQRWVGQVQEISWRATVLLGMSDELVTVPNRTMGQAQISNFAAKNRPIIRSQIFRISFDAQIDAARKALLDAAARARGIKKLPSPITLVGETTDSWTPVKLVYYIDDYGTQFTIADELIARCLQNLKKEGIEPAGPRIKVQN